MSHLFGQSLDSLLIYHPNKAYEVAVEAMEEKPRAKFLAVIIEANLNLGNYTRADSLYTSYIPRLDWPYVDSNNLMEAKRSIARVYSIQFRFEEAFILFNEVLDYYSSKNKRNKIAHTKVNLAEYYRIMGQLDPAQDLLLDLINERSFERSVSPAVKANIYHRLAAIIRKTDNSEQQALSYLRKSLSYSEPIQHLDHMATVYTEMGDIYQVLDDSRSLVYLYKALEVWEQLGYPHYLANAHLNIVRYLEGQGELEGAAKHLDDVLAIGSNYPSMLNMALEFKALILFKQGKYKEAFILRDSCANLRVNLMLKQSDIDILEITRRFQTDIARAELISSKKQEDLANIKTEEEIKKRKAYAIGLVFLLILIGVVSSLYYILQREQRAIHSKNKIIGQKNQQLRTSLQEKDTLLREVHHRVKNNLQIISSLIEMQKLGSETNIINEEGVQSLLGRITTMGLVHERLYNQDILGKVQVKEYLQDLVSQLKTMDLGQRPTSIKLECDAITMDISKSISLGMIVNELVYNSIKHAFDKSDSNPCICIKFNLKGEEKAEFEYHDNGHGKNDKVAEGFGMRLVRMFTRQLDAELNLNNSNGFHLTLNFSTDDE